MANYGNIGPYRLFFTTNDLDEPPHVHLERDGLVAKFWLSPVQLAKSSRFAAHELTRMQRIVRENQQSILENWYELRSRRK